MTDAIQVSDLFDTGALRNHLAEGTIRSQRHPDLPLTIYNYSERCVFENAWDQVTLTCRGLIVSDDGTVVARPFRKFFNYGQPGAPDLDLRSPAEVTDKADGSLGILYPTPDGHAVATRGSFTSDQAIHATELWRDRYEGRVVVGDRSTWLFEIVYPSNRIVVDYGDTDDLFLLGLVDLDTGRTVGPAEVGQGWPGPAVETFAYGTLAEALEAPPRPNAEGLVVYSLDTGERIKLKQDDYVALHRIVTGLNARTVWQHLCDGFDLDDLIEPLPDEFHPWVRDVADKLTSQVAERHEAIVRDYQQLVDSLPAGFTRKEYAERAVPHPERAALFAMLDGKDVYPALWRDAKPEAYWTPAGRRFTEDVA